MTPKFNKYKVLDKDFKEVEVSISEIPYDVFKSVRGMLKDHPDKAILVLNANIVKKEDQPIIQGIIDSNSTKLILPLEDLFASLIYEDTDSLKKK